MLYQYYTSHMKWSLTISYIPHVSFVYIGDPVVSTASTVALLSGGSDTTNVPIDVSVLREGDEVELELGYMGPFDKAVRIGGGNTNRMIVISLG